jgi:hypothetical protein
MRDEPSPPKTVESGVTQSKWPIIKLLTWFNFRSAQVDPATGDSGQEDALVINRTPNKLNQSVG